MDIVAVLISVAVLQGLICGSFTAYLVHKKGRGDAFPWFVFGLVFGTFALLAAIGLPQETATPSGRTLAGYEPAEEPLPNLRKKETLRTGRWNRGDRIIVPEGEEPLVAPGEKGTIEGVSLADRNMLYVRFDSGLACWVRGDKLQEVERE